MTHAPIGIAPTGAAAPVFVVGLPRSGTTLLTAMLGAHSRLDCGPETHFFAHLRRARLPRLLDPARWPASGVAFVESLSAGGARIHELFEVPLPAVSEFLAQRSPSVRALLESLTMSRAVRSGKPRWIEKTPNHLLHTETVRALFTDAQIVRIVRDPRDVALSLRKVPFASRSALANLYSWLERDERSRAFFDTDAASITVRYEDLVSSPRHVLERLCGFLGEEFEDRMLDPAASADAVIGTGEWWKENVRRPVSGARVQAWQHELSPAEQQAAALICAEALERYGYPGAVAARQTWRWQPLTADFIEQNEGVLTRLAARGIRLAPYDMARELPQVAWGLPGQLRWPLGKTTGARLRTVAAFARQVLTSRATGRSIAWVAESSGLPMSRGMLDSACDFAMRISARQMSGATVLEAAGDDAVI